MKKQSMVGIAGVALLIGGTFVAAGFPTRVFAGKSEKSEKYIHVRVNQSDDDEKVSVNVPLSLAEKILPAIHNRDLHDGKVKIGHDTMDSADVKQILEAVATAPDGEFVTVQEKDQEVRVAKSNGNIIVHVTGSRRRSAKDHSRNRTEDGTSDATQKPTKDDRSKDDRNKDNTASNRPENVEVIVPISVVNALVSADREELNIGAALRALGDAGDAVLITVHDGTDDVRIWVDSKSSGD